jgi:chromosome segregation ATPase
MDVEAILKEIRSRVVSDVQANAASPETDWSSNNSGLSPNQSESLARVSAHLAVTGRAWDGLPPISSNRHGTLAQIELWVKRKSKPLTRWFTWEQLNFNRAVNDALCDVVEILKAEAHELSSMRAQLIQEMRREFTTLRTGADEQARLLQDMQARAHQADAALARVNQMVASLSDENRNRHKKLGEENLRVQSDLTSLQADLGTLQGKHATMQAEHATLQVQHARLQAEHLNLEAEHSKLANQVIELAGQLREEDREIKLQQDREINRRLTALAAELKEEQRVCFRQVSLEASESAVLEDRARRALLQRLEKLEAALKAGGRG